MQRLIDNPATALAAAGSGSDAVAQDRDAMDQLLQLSLDKVRWKTSGLIDRLEALFDDDLVFVHITGHISSKRQWIAQMRSRRFVYKAIVPQGASVARVAEDRALLTGKAMFSVTMGGFRCEYRLAFTETDRRRNGAWTLIERRTATC
jgi:hypothetical protein